MSNLFSINDSIGWFLLGLSPAELYQGQQSWGLGTKTVIPLGATFGLRARQRRRGALELVVCGASRRDAKGARDRERPSTENWLANPAIIRTEALRDYPLKLEFDRPWLMQGIKSCGNRIPLPPSPSLLITVLHRCVQNRPFRPTRTTGA
jgi:hypothetical protein